MASIINWNGRATAALQALDAGDQARAKNAVNVQVDSQCSGWHAGQEGPIAAVQFKERRLTATVEKSATEHNTFGVLSLTIT